MFYIIWGTCLRGTIVSDDGRTLKTRFFHLWYIPIIPIGGAECIDDNDYEADIDGSSVLLGYLRTYLFLALVFNLFGIKDDYDQISTSSLLFSLVFGLTWLCSMFAGRKMFETSAE